jgi:uncharacterized membrane protein YdjX (TVP38/TMEM64 family)
MATTTSPQHAGDIIASCVAMEGGRGPLHEEYVTRPSYYATMAMEEGRIQEDATTTTSASSVATIAAAVTATAITTPARTDYYGSLPSSDKSIKEELVELFWELMKFNRQRNWKKKVLAASMGICTVLVVVDLIFLGNIVYVIHKFAAWMSLHIFPGTLLFIVLLTCCTLIMIPPSILIFVCGYVFSEVAGLATGIPAAVLASFAGCAVGAILAFLRARYMMRDLFDLFSKRYKIVRAVDKSIEHHGFRVMLLLRLCPVIPFNGLNYFGGVTSISIDDYIYALVGTLPLIILTVVAGAGAESLSAKQEMTASEYAIRRVQIMAGLLFVLIAVIITLYKAKKELLRELEAELQAEFVLAQNASPVETLPVMPVAIDVKPPNTVLASEIISTTREPKLTEQRSQVQSGRSGSRSKLSTRKPASLQTASMPNAMTKTGKRMSQRNSLRDFKQPSIPNTMVAPANTSTSQRGQQGESERTSNSDSEPPKRRSHNERALSARDVTATTRNQKSRGALVSGKKQTSERNFRRASRQSSETKSVDDAQMLPKKLVKVDTKVGSQGLNANPASNGRTVTIAKFLKDDNRNRAKPHKVEAVDARSTKALSSLPVHKRMVPTTAHATRRPGMPPKASSQRSVVQNRKSGPRSGTVRSTPTPPRALSSKAKRPAYLTSKSESFLGSMPICPYPLEDEFPGFSRYGCQTESSDGLV